jgi:formamidopyrimidine-DNA glycosylase
MPELPEVETIVRELRKKVLRRTFFDMWTDNPKMIYFCNDFKKQVKNLRDINEFKKEIKGKVINNIWRRGKNIIFDLSKNKSLLIHQKLTGHLLVGQWRLNKGLWEPIDNNFLKEPVNRYIHLMFWLSGDLMLALSDLRKFAKVELWDSDKLKKSRELNELGPEPLDKNFTFQIFKNVLPKKGKIKQVLMNQTVVAGIGNIYSDEILWEARVYPLKDVSKLSEKELNEIYQAIKKILKTAIKLKGESFSDFRRTSGEKGNFDKERKVYQKEGEKCFRCGATIQRVKLGGRSAHFCPVCQKSD